jgi:hypothetical protein
MDEKKTRNKNTVTEQDTAGGYGKGEGEREGEKERKEIFKAGREGSRESGKRILRR